MHAPWNKGRRRSQTAQPRRVSFRIVSLMLVCLARLKAECRKALGAGELAHLHALYYARSDMLSDERGITEVVASLGYPNPARTIAATQAELGWQPGRICTLRGFVRIVTQVKHAADRLTSQDVRNAFLALCDAPDKSAGAGGGGGGAAADEAWVPPFERRGGQSGSGGGDTLSGQQIDAACAEIGLAVSVDPGRRYAYSDWVALVGDTQGSGALTDFQRAVALDEELFHGEADAARLMKHRRQSRTRGRPVLAYRPVNSLATVEQQSEYLSGKARQDEPLRRLHVRCTAIIAAVRLKGAARRRKSRASARAGSPQGGEKRTSIIKLAIKKPNFARAPPHADLAAAVPERQPRASRSVSRLSADPRLPADPRRSSYLDDIDLHDVSLRDAPPGPMTPPAAQPLAVHALPQKEDSTAAVTAEASAAAGGGGGGGGDAGFFANLGFSCAQQTVSPAQSPAQSPTRSAAAAAAAAAEVAGVGGAPASPSAAAGGLRLALSAAASASEAEASGAAGMQASPSSSVKLAEETGGGLLLPSCGRGGEAVRAAPATRRGYKRAVKDWRNHMTTEEVCRMLPSLEEQKRFAVVRAELQARLRPRLKPIARDDHTAMHTLALASPRRAPGRAALAQAATPLKLGDCDTEQQARLAGWLRNEKIRAPPRRVSPFLTCPTEELRPFYKARSRPGMAYS